MIQPPEALTSDRLRERPLYIRHMLAARVLFPLGVLVFLGLSLSSWGAMLEFVWHCWSNKTLISRVILRYQLVLGLPVFLMFGMAFLTYCVYREVWVLRADSLSRFGIFRTRTISWNEVTSLDWWPFQRMIVLRSADVRISLFLDSLNPALRLQFIRYLHQAVPAEKQKHWSLFCHWMALPLQQRYAVDFPPSKTSRPTSPEESLTLWNQGERCLHPGASAEAAHHEW